MQTHQRDEIFTLLLRTDREDENSYNEAFAKTMDFCTTNEGKIINYLPKDGTAKIRLPAGKIQGLHGKNIIYGRTANQNTYAESVAIIDDAGNTLTVKTGNDSKIEIALLPISTTDRTEQPTADMETTTTRTFNFGTVKQESTNAEHPETRRIDVWLTKDPESTLENPTHEKSISILFNMLKEHNSALVSYEKDIEICTIDATWDIVKALKKAPEVCESLTKKGGLPFKGTQINAQNAIIFMGSLSEFGNLPKFPEQR